MSPDLNLAHAASLPTLERLPWHRRYRRAFEFLATRVHPGRQLSTGPAELLKAHDRPARKSRAMLHGNRSEKGVEVEL